MSRIPKANAARTRPPLTLANLPSRPLIPAAGSLSSEAKALYQPLPPLPTIFSRPQALRRRSKSVADLRTLTAKPMPKFGSSNVENTKPAARMGLKRVGAPAATEVKPKKAKVPVWDYKTRFQNLLEQHSALQASLDTLRTKAAAYDAAQGEKEAMQKKLNETLNELESTSLNQQQLKTELLTLEKKDLLKSSKIQLLEENVTQLKAEVDELNRQTSELKEQLNVEQAKNSTLIAEMNALKSELAAAKDRLLEMERIQQEYFATRRIMHNQIQDLKGNIRVFCRVRPAVTREEQDRVLAAIHFPSDNSLEIRKSKESVNSLARKNGELKLEFTFDKVFPPETQQAEIFEELSQLVQSALDGYDVCVFAYGQTGSGKTHTMQGNERDPGMIPRTVDLIFDSIRELEISNWTYKVSASFLEIYNEGIRDLLQCNPTNTCEVKYNDGRGVTVTNLQICPISNAAHLKELMATANSNRAVAETDFNKHSSRSHAVTKIHLEGFNSGNNCKFTGSLNLVDLAGSESAKTSADDRLTETKNINKSLSTLGTVMMALHNNDSHVPYRNSKLTFLLQSCLGGNSKTLMITNVAPFEESFAESVNSLRFAAKVKEVKTASRKNKQYS